MKAAIALLVLTSTAFCAQKPSPSANHLEEAAFNPAKSVGTISKDLCQPSKEPYRVGPGDKLDIELLGADSTRKTALIGPDGKLYYDLAPGIDVTALTLEEVRTELCKQLSNFYRDPQISVTVSEIRSKRVWVLGRLNKPGIYPLTRPTTIVDAISQAGGLFTSRFSGTTEELADLDHSFIMRGRKHIPVNFAALLRQGDMSQNIYLEANDLIYLPSALNMELNVLGAVRQPRSVGFSQDMSIVSALGMALGPTPDADLRHVAIVRGSLSKPQVAIVDFIAIQEGKAPSVRLQPKDIVYVPTSSTLWRSLGQLLETVTNTFVRSVSANEGSRAGLPAAPPIRPQLNIGQ